MTTIEKIKSEINLQVELANDTNNIYEDCTNEMIIDSIVYSKLIEKFRNESNEDNKSFISASRSSIEYSTKYMIENESVINSLRTLWQTSKNKFVKDVIATIGQTKTFTSKQIGVVADEIIKINFNLNF